ncbi:MAG: hypothetical protein J6Y19_00880, partial [Kiritimatiellae bacterium]|nr:hypothetical protein [Kiritimatiellia bacterium]
GWMFAEAQFRHNTTIHRSVAVKNGEFLYDSHDQYGTPYLSGGYGWGGNLITSCDLTGSVQTPFGPITGLAGISWTGSWETKVMANTKDGFTEVIHADHSSEVKWRAEVKMPLTKKELKKEIKKQAKQFVWRTLSPQRRKELAKEEKKFEAESAKMLADLNGNVEEAAAKYAKYAAEFDERMKELQGYKDELQGKVEEYKGQLDELQRKVEECEAQLKNAEETWKKAKDKLEKEMAGIIRRKLAYVSGYAEKWLGISTRDLLGNASKMREFIDEGYLKGILPGEDPMIVLKSIKDKDASLFKLGKEVGKNAVKKGIATSKQKGYEKVQPLLETQLDQLNQFSEELPFGSVVMDALSGKAPLSDPSTIVREMSNPLTGIVADFGNGVQQTLSNAGETFLNPVFEQAGNYFMQIKATYASFSPNVLGEFVQVQHLDPQGEDFAFVEKAAIGAAADLAGIQGPALAVKNAWNGLNGDKVPLALKAALKLNPLSWDSSGEMILDDDWKLRMGFPNAADVKAAQDADGDGWTNEEEYQGKHLEKEPGPDPQGRRGRRGGEPHTPAKNATHPLKRDTDEGGLPDGFE